MDENIRVPNSTEHNDVITFAAPSSIGEAGDNSHSANRPTQTSTITMTPSSIGGVIDEDEEDKMLPLVDSSSDGIQDASVDSDSSSDSSEKAESFTEYLKRVYPPLREL